MKKCRYDSVGDVIGQNVQLGGVSQNVILSSAYDYNGQRSSLAANIGGQFDPVAGTATSGTNDFFNSYLYDRQGNVVNLSQTTQYGTGSYYVITPKTVTFSYDFDSRLLLATYYQNPDNTVNPTTNPIASAQYAYDADSRLSDLTYVANNNSTWPTLAAYHWSYDADSRVTDEYSRADASSATNGSYTTWAHTHYNYDQDSQLSNTTADGVTTNAVTYGNWRNAPSPSGSTPGTNSVTYDQNGNRQTANAASRSTSTNQLLFDGTFYYTYDAAGNRTAKYQLNGDVPTNITGYTWNNANELVAVKQYSSWSNYLSHSGATSEIDYTYDAFGNKVSRTVKDSGGNVTSNENYIYDGSNLALVLNSSGVVTERELYAPAVDQILASEAGGTVNWFFNDNQGTVRDVARYNASTGTATVVDHLVYDPFGNITSQTNATYQPFITYAGMQLDTATGLLKDGVRQYDPQNSIFISQDPIGFNDGGTNLVMYCANSPTNYTDPSGLWGIFDSVNNAAANPPPNIMFESARGEAPRDPAEDANFERAAFGNRASATIPLRNQQFAGNLSVIASTVGIQTGYGSCFVAGTVVSTLSGLIRIEDISIGSEVWAFDLVNGEWRPAWWNKRLRIAMKERWSKST